MNWYILYCDSENSQHYNSIAYEFGISNAHSIRMYLGFVYRKKKSRKERFLCQ